MEDYKQRLANEIKQLRLDKNLTQLKLAEILDISVSQMQNIERLRSLPSIEILYKLSRLGLSVDNVFSGAQSKNAELINHILVKLDCLNASRLKFIEAMADALLKLD